MPTRIDAVRENFSRRTDIQGELRQIDEAADHDSRAYTDDETARITELRSELASVDDRITSSLEIEARSQVIESSASQLLGQYLDRDSGETIDRRSVGQRFTESDAFQAFAQRSGGLPRVDLDGVELRAVVDTTTGSTSGGAFIVPTMLDRVGMLNLPRRVYLTDLLQTIPIASGSVEYVQDASPLADLDNKAAEVAEDSAKPQAGITTALVVEPVATVAAWVNLTRQAAADVPQLQAYLQGRLAYSLKRRVDGQVIGGNGTTPNLKGLGSRANIITYAPGAAEARNISIRHAITLMEQAEAVPEIVVINPADAELFDLTNATTAGLHAVQDLAAGVSRTAWGLTQVHSNAVTAGTALLIDPTAVALLDRQQPTAYMTDSHASNFTSNILTLLLELRLGLALIDPSSVAKVTFNGTA